MLTTTGPWANLRVPAPDGTVLTVDVHLPAPDRWPVPVVVTRTPYGRAKHLAEGRGWRQHGFAYVAADVRGRYDSDGVWEPYRNERADGAALADWITAQPWCDGRLIAYGGSYAGYTAWALAVERPAAVAAVVSLGPSMSLRGTKFDPSGVLRLGEHASWWLERAESRTSRDGLARLVFAERPGLLDHLPVVDLADRLGARLPRWTDVLTGDDGEPVTDAELAALPAASLHVGGWYDLLLTETLRHWHLAGSARDPRPSRRLVIGPWDHDLAFSDRTGVGAREHGPASRMSFEQICLRWLRAVLAGEPPRQQAEVFVLGADTWCAADDWPGRAATVTLHPAGDGTLAAPEPRQTGVTAFTYDPADPFPSRHPGADRSDTQDRPDAARFRTAVLHEPLTVWGTPSVDLVADGDAPDTDWTARLLEARADGTVLEIARGTVVDGTGSRTIVLGPAAITVPAGARLVLEVTASDFPLLARNLGTGQDRYRGTTTRATEHRVRWGACGTALHLPVRAGEPA